MSRKYRHIIEYETEIISMVNQGLTLREIGNKLGFTYNEIQDFKTRYNKKQRMIEEGKASIRVVWWLGKCGHEWQAIVSERTKQTKPRKEGGVRKAFSCV